MINETTQSTKPATREEMADHIADIFIIGDDPLNYPHIVASAVIGLLGRFGCLLPEEAAELRAERDGAIEAAHVATLLRDEKRDALAARLARAEDGA